MSSVRAMRSSSSTCKATAAPALFAVPTADAVIGPVTAYSRLKISNVTYVDPELLRTTAVAEMRPALGGEPKRAAEAVEHHHARQVACPQRPRATDWRNRRAERT